jgi:RND superfamily putative drug exporter
VTGLGTMQAAVIKARGQIPSTRDLERLQRQSPGIFNSGYFVLAAVEGSQPADRNAATFVINLPHGGNAGQIVVTGRYPVSDARAEKLGERLRALSSGFAKANHVDVAVGGPAGSLFDTARTASDKLPAVIIGTVLGITLLLALFLRSVLIPAVAVLCAALTTASSFGVMQLLFGGSNPPLGGPGTFDPVTLTELLAAIFGATLVYIVVLMTRTRDYYIASGDPRRSLVAAMRATKAATTGMAAITIGTLIPFMFTELQPVRRIAVAAAVAVAIVAYVVVPVLLPAAMSALGRLGWWPTHGPPRSEPHVARGASRRLPRWHMPRRHPRPAH